MMPAGTGTAAPAGEAVKYRRNDAELDASEAGIGDIAVCWLCRGTASTLREQH
jgi:hypothetical protein